MVPEEDHPIAEYLVGSLDEDGYLQVDVAEVAEECGATVERVQHVLARLQTLDPVGIGARDLRECLLIQLDYLEHEEGLTHPLAREIVLFHLPEMAERRYQQIARALNAPVAAVTEACEFIRRELNPYPSRQGESFRPGSGERRTARVLPDIIIARGEHGFEVDVVESQKFELQISPTYRDLLERMEKDPEQFAAEEREHVRHHVSRARLFLDSVRQRRETMRRIAECLVDEQRDFLERGVRSIKPLTRAAVAEKLGLHESTVSRATAKKYAMLPDRRVIPLSDFFTPSLGPKDVIREIIASESQPLTDAEIASRLRERGIVIARRTVAKYRAEMGILPAGLR
jgi:RNA polymerase sigma-54 factor